MVEILSTEKQVMVDCDEILFVHETVEVNEVTEVMPYDDNTDYLLLQTNEQTIRYVVRDDADEQDENDDAHHKTMQHVYGDEQVETEVDEVIEVM